MFWIQNCFSVSDGGFLLWFFGYRITGFSLGYKDLLAGFHGMFGQTFFRTLDFNWIVKVLDLVSVDLRILVSDFDTGFGHLVFVDLVVLVC